MVTVGGKQEAEGREGVLCRTGICNTACRQCVNKQRC